MKNLKRSYCKCGAKTKNASALCQRCLGPRACVTCRGAGVLRRVKHKPHTCSDCGGTGVRRKSEFGKPGNAVAQVPGDKICYTTFFEEGEWCYVALIYRGKEILTGKFKDPDHARRVANRWLKDAGAI